jgi:hypothetical protein
VKDKEGCCKFFIHKENKLLERFEIKSVGKSLMKGLLSLQQVKITLSPGRFLFAQLLNKEGRWQLDFIFPNAEENKSLREVIGKCPACGSNVYETSYGFSCDKNKKDSPDKCNFFLNKEDKFFGNFGKTINKTIAKSFLSSGRASVKGLVSKKTGNSFDATFILKQNGAYWGFDMEFNNKKS